MDKLTVRELINLLTKYEGSDIVMLEGGEGAGGAYAILGIAKEEVDNYNGQTFKHLVIETPIMEFGE